MRAAAGEAYTIRRQIFRLFGAGFHVYGADGNLVAFCKQKAFRLREDFRLYTDSSQKEEFLTVAARQVIDFSAAYDVKLPSGEKIGSLKRKGFKSTFYKDTWSICDEQDAEIGTLEEQGSVLPVVRRVVDAVSFFFPQTYVLTNDRGEMVGRYRQHFNPFIFRFGVTLTGSDERFDDLLVLAIGTVVAAIEGRQD